MRWTKDTFNEIYQRYLDSGQEIKAFCADNGIHDSRFYRWQRKLRSEAINTSDTFLPVSINNRGGQMVLAQRGIAAKTTAHPSCEISLPNGVTIRLSDGITPDLLHGILTLVC